jgi:D-alanyl-D-alanine-carboxypeptidase/D-alanyl-D-alanine-endopeptidase
MRLLFSCILILCLPGAWAQTPSPASTVDLGNASALGAELFSHSGTTGMVLVVVHNDKVFIEGYGQTAPRSRELPTATSQVRLCSLTKIFTTDLLTKLALDHVVKLNDPLQNYAPSGVTVPERNQQSVRLIDLATHTAGLNREVGYPPDGMAHFTYPDHTLRWSWLPKQHLRWTPGTIASYSNIGYDLLSDALETAGHKPYAAQLDERTLRPLRMWHTTYFPTPDQCQHLMVSAQGDGACTSTVNTQGSSGLYSTPADMANWLKYLLGTGGKGFPAQPREAQAVYLAPDQLVRESGLNYGGDPSGIGLGWVHVLAPDDPSHLIEKTGGGAGFLTYIAIHPASHTALFVAVTEGARLPHVTHFNLFKSSNSVLLKLVGAPLIPEEPAGPRGRQRKVRNALPATPARSGKHAQAHARVQPALPAAKAHTPRGKAHTPTGKTRAQSGKQHVQPARKTPRKSHAVPAHKRK